MEQLPLFQPPSWTVADLTRYLRELLENDDTLQDVWVVGEVSNFSRPASGHLYFTLKDASASLRCVMWRAAAARQPFAIRDGMALEVHGAISVYDAGGQYQLYADLFRPAGEGQLYQEFLRLKARLEAEGLFDPARKRPIPRWPQTIGIVTSPTGAALRDILNTLTRRYPLARLVLAPTPVQGDDAPPGIVQALEGLNRVVQPDVILLARGGGSIEDLWAFNDERVARAVAASLAPVICGVGHETDFTIADFVADVRAPTPTAAAELASPNYLDLLAVLDDSIQRLNRMYKDGLESRRWSLTGLESSLRLHSPASRLRSDRQRLDEFSRRSSLLLDHALHLRRAQLSGVHQRLAALSPQAVLQRGYAIVTSQDGSLVRSAAQVRPADPIHVRLVDGAFDARVSEKL